MADMASAMPTAGGLYWWTHYFAGQKWKNPLSFLVGYSNTLGLIGGICSVDYTLSLLILACISIARDGTWSASNGTIYGLYAGLILVHGACTILASNIMPRIQTLCIYINVAIVIATVVALPAGKVARGGTLNSAHYVFTHVDNLSNWPIGWTFVLAFLSPIWSIGFFDSCVHMSEEAMHAARAVPRGILFSAGSACVLGFLILSVIAAVMDPDVNNTAGTVFGQPMAQVLLLYLLLLLYNANRDRSTTTPSANTAPWVSWLFSFSSSSSSGFPWSVSTPILPDIIDKILTKADHSRLPTSVRLRARPRPPLLAHPAPYHNPRHNKASTHKRHPLPGRNLHHLRPAGADQQRRRECAVLALRREQLRRVGHAHSVQINLEIEIHPGRVLYWQCV